MRITGRVITVGVTACALAAVCGCSLSQAPKTVDASEGATVAPAAEAPAPAGASAPSATLASTAVPRRRIIYTAEVDLVAERLTEAATALERLVKAHHGYVAGSEVTGSPGAPRQGNWKVRIPADEFEAFMAAVPRLGELQRIHTDSEDVGEEYADLQARLSNKRVEEQRLIKHLANSTAKLQDILAVEQELSRVRGEAEQIEGRLRYLTDRTDLTTVTVRLYEVKAYLPPERTTFGAQVGRTFQSSVQAMVDLGKTLVLLVIAAGPWLMLAAVVAAPVWLAIRRRRAAIRGALPQRPV